MVASLHVGVPVCRKRSSCTSSSSDWMTGVFDPSSLDAWLSQVELEEVDNMRALNSLESGIPEGVRFLRKSSSTSVWLKTGEEMNC